MRVIDLTMPISEGMTFGNVFPQGGIFEVDVMMDWDTHGARIGRYAVYSEQGTRLVLYTLFAPYQKDDLRLDRVNIVLRDTVVVDIPKGPGEKVTPEELENTLARADYRDGDAILFRTGWGNDDRYRKLGDDYELKNPNFGRDDTLQKLVDIMVAKKSDLFCTDTASVSDMVARYQDWLARKPRPETYPSPEAKAYMKAHESTPEQRKELLNKGLFIIAGAKINFIPALVNCDQITKERVKLIALPLKVQGECVAQCNVVASEE